MTQHMRNIFCILLPLTFTLLVIAAVAGCGKSGYPEPRDDSRSFSWVEAQAIPVGKCLAFTGTLQGAYTHLDNIRLEIDPVDGPEDCPGCPFVPSETLMYSPVDAGFNPKNGDISFSYCPSRANAYRWKLIGISIYTSQPHAVSPEGLTVMHGE